MNSVLHQTELCHANQALSCLSLAFMQELPTMQPNMWSDLISLWCAEQGRLHAARSVASGLAQFINTTAMTLVHHGTINAELQDACHAAFKT
jgi:hypothetical protein